MLEDEIVDLFNTYEKTEDDFVRRDALDKLHK